ncbi:hypothetical protein CP10139811_0165 [Chlamydia ibidis]|uniref:Putative pre-16S rRNA nuclease n=2 Tax=Chlamydia ibidis TaxID=1405396 RepID=S7J4H7_9CHLA|nr:Holliday junction resolvase RuvX [Chlamydia ibidis]EPP35304.1 hypothetical protein CP10139811_0165 [Chlamydia ibidis]EQM62543.1 hypothetical protein H359_0607 [Chlamydia ibidis 10-1398/6]
MFKSYLAVDYGKKRIGLAYASSPLLISLPIGTIESHKELVDTAKSICKVVRDRCITCVVLGNPLPMRKGYLSPLQEEIVMLASLIREISGVEIILWDERLSSAQAERMLKNDCELNRKKRKGKTDSLAATLILTSFLESLSQ